MSDILSELRWRGLIQEETEGVDDYLDSRRVTLYNGFDPTGDSLHIGNLVPLLALARFQRMGHTPIALAGGGTALIGDPSGKSAERPLLSIEEIHANTENLRPQLAKLLDFEVKSNPAKLLNNIDWLQPLSMFDYLREVGKHFTVNYMMAKDSVKSRTERDQGISYTEFSYMLLQAYDFLHLQRTHGCTLQTGGSDQWGNITAGIELNRRADAKKVHALAYPLITRADGTKFGKTASGESVWLDEKKTSPYKFYQFWYNVDDRDVVSYLKIFTWLSKEEIDSLQHEMEQTPEARIPQKELAVSVTKMIHGESGLAKAERASAVLFGGDIEGLNADDISDIFSDVPRAKVTKSKLLTPDYYVTDLIMDTGLSSSKGEARRLIKNGGISINNNRIDDEKVLIDLPMLVEGKYLVLRRGKREYRLVEVDD
jgi:tyrosyl-tRNA synthetase